MGTLVRTPCQNKKSREPSSQDFWQGHKWLTRRMAPPMCFPWENTLAFADPHTKTKDHRMVVFCFGRGTKARTLDTRFWRPLLYQLSYTPVCPSGHFKVLYHINYGLASVF